MNQSKEKLDIAILGAGFSGLGAGILLKQQGETSFKIFERANEVGGTWRDNTYPGCGCDVPSLLYSYSFEPNPNWSHAFSKQGEILGYMKHCVQKYEMEQYIQYNTTIDGLVFDKEKGLWNIRDKAGRTYQARFVLSAVGPFNAPMIPNIKGKDSFQGEAFHSLRWNHDYELKNKRVAVIGTGASAIQFVPEIAKEVKELYIFQRTAPYVTPKPDEAFTETAKNRFKRFPWYQRFWREVIYWILELQGLALYSNNFIRSFRKWRSLKHLENQISDPELRKLLTPDYELGCKRVLVSDDYYPTLLQEHVELIGEGVTEILPNAVRTKSGITKEVDAIIFGTGFHVTDFPNLFEVIGLSGDNMFQRFNEQGPEGYLGVAVTDYPNLLIMVGPNSGLGHNSIIHMMESQYAYALDYWRLLKEQDENAYFNLKSSVQDSFNENLQKELSKMVWSEGGCSSYYLKNGDGKNNSIWPGSTMKYRRKTKKVNLKDYEIITPKVTAIV